jgi:transcription elongation GreA/GreB family factor
MGNIDILNSNYLTQVDANEAPELVLLPHEVTAVQEALARHEANFQEVIREKVSVTGGDDWHDGAFRATDNQANIISESMAAIATYQHASVVDYPDEDSPRISLGSRVYVRQQSFVYPIDIVGFRGAYPSEVIDPVTEEEVDAMTPNSPLARAVLGKIVGDVASFRSGERRLEVQVERIDQTAVRKLFMDVLGIAVDTTDMSLASDSTQTEE